MGKKAELKKYMKKIMPFVSVVIDKVRADVSEPGDVHECSLGH